MKTLDLIDWTMHEAKQLRPEHHIPRALDVTPSPNKLLEVLKGERVKPNAVGAISSIASAPSMTMALEEPIARPSTKAGVAPKPDTLSNLPAPQAAPPADGRTEAPKSALLLAIVQPDIYTDRVDFDRAIALRWTLRDIKSDRLKWSPVNQHDLQILIEMGLVEMRDDAPTLTNEGFSAIL